MQKLCVAFLLVVIAQVAYSQILVDGGDIVIRAKRNDPVVEGSGEGSGEITTEASGQVLSPEGSGEGSGSEPVVEAVVPTTSEASLLSDMLTKDVKPAEEIAA